jgi:hypothetical protein
VAQRSANLVTQAEYARSRKARGLPGGSRKAVHAAVHDGSIDAFGPDKLIDQELADRQWAKNRRARIGTQPAAGHASGDLLGMGDAPAPAPAAASSSQPDSSYTLARTRRENAEAEQAEIELRRKKGELVLRDDVDRAFVEIARELRDRLMACGRRTAAECAALTSAEACEAVIDREHRIVLELLVTGFRERVGVPPGAGA